MSKHSKWAKIKRKKAVLDGKRGAKFTQLSRQITMEAKNGGDPSMNALLAMAVEKAKAANMTGEAITKAIKKGTGELKGEAEVVEMLYEGYAPHGVAVMIRTITDNTNRTVGSLRHIFSKYGGALGNSGSVAFQFQKQGVIILPLQGMLTESQEMALIESGADDYEIIDDEEIHVITSPTEMHILKSSLEKAGFQVKEMKMIYAPINYTVLTEGPQLDEVMKVLDLVEEDDDVDEVFTNIQVDDTL